MPSGTGPRQVAPRCNGRNGMPAAAHGVPPSRCRSLVVVPSGARTARLVADRAGNLTAVWIEGLISSERLVGSHYDAARGAWTVPAQLDDLVNNISQLDVVTDSAGSAPWHGAGQPRRPGRGPGRQGERGGRQPHRCAAGQRAALTRVAFAQSCASSRLAHALTSASPPARPPGSGRTRRWCPAGRCAAPPWAASPAPRAPA